MSQYHKTPKNSETQKKIYCNCQKNWFTWIFYVFSIGCVLDAEWMADSVDPDQTAPLAVGSGSTLFTQTYLPKNLGTLRNVASWKKN